MWLPLTASVARYVDLLELSARDSQLVRVSLCCRLTYRRRRCVPTLQTSTQSGGKLLGLHRTTADHCRELMHMLHLNRKAEIQILSGPPSGHTWARAPPVGLSVPVTSNRLVEYIISKLSPSN